jgi:hypothetical protein
MTNLTHLDIGHIGYFEPEEHAGPAGLIRVVQKLQFLNNNRLKMAKCGAFCRTCSRTNRVLEQVYYR